MRIADGHFEDIIHFLTTGTARQGYFFQQKKELVIHATNFTLIAGLLYKMGNDEILHRCVLEFKRGQILAKAHGGVVSRHYAGRAIAQKILRAGLWWPTLHQDSKAYCQTYDVCQWTGKPLRKDEMPLQPQMMLQPFEKWEIDFTGTIKPRGKIGAHYIITATNYLT